MKSNQIKSNQNETKQNKTKQNKTKQNKTDIPCNVMKYLPYQNSFRFFNKADKR